MKSVPLVACPAAVWTVIRPDPATAGTAVWMVVGLADITVAAVPLNLTVLREGSASKFVPEMVTGVEGAPTAGVKELTVGAPGATVTTKELLLVALLVGVVTVIGPVVAAGGTTVMIWVVVEDVTVAVTPLNCTVFSLGTARKPEPRIVTVVPTGPLVGLKLAIETWEEPWRVIDNRLPTAS